MAFLHTNNKHAEKEMMDIIPLTGASRPIKYPGVKLTKKVNLTRKGIELCHEKFKYLKKSRKTLENEKTSHSQSLKKTRIDD